MIKKAAIEDVKAIHALLQVYGKKGELLQRPLSQLYDHVRSFFVVTEEKSGQLIGCCALQFCWEDLAEIRSLAVHPEHLNKNIGSQLVQKALSDAKQFSIKKVFTLTYQPDFFKNFGFIKIERSDLPLKIWGDCLICIKFPDCDEIAMMKEMEYPS
jgi:amino-acid N-acetyltransferase